MLRLPVLLVVLAAALVSGCSDGDVGCAGQSYDADLTQQGAATPIGALEAWLGDHAGFDEQPPVEGWLVQDTGERDAARVVIVNDGGDGWWVEALRTSGGGYVVEQATDDAAGCADELP